MTGGWIIAVLVELDGEPRPWRHYFAVGQADQAQAEWAAVDSATGLGAVAPGPTGGMEPVEAVRALSPRTVKAFGLGDREVRPLGPRLPRRWLLA